MTLNCYKFSFFRNFALFWEGAAKRIKIDPHCQRRNPFALKALFNNAHRVQLKMQLKPNGPTPRSQAVITRRYAWKFLRQILHACLAWFRPLMCCFCMKLFYAYEMVEQPSSAMLHGYSRPRRRIGFFWAPEFLGCSRFTRSPMLGLARARTPLFFTRLYRQWRRSWVACLEVLTQSLSHSGDQIGTDPHFLLPCCYTWPVIHYYLIYSPTSVLPALSSLSRWCVSDRES